MKPEVSWALTPPLFKTLTFAEKNCLLKREVFSFFGFRSQSEATNIIWPMYRHSFRRQQIPVRPVRGGEAAEGGGSTFT